MRVLLISANTENINMVPLPLGLNCVAVAARNAGHKVELLDLMGNNDHSSAISDAIERVHPGVIGISVRNIDNQLMGETRFLLNPVREIVTMCRTCSSVPIVVGGAGFSIFPEAALAYLGADMGVSGEGEVAFPLLLDTLERGDDSANIRGICLPGQPLKNGCAERATLHSLPLPDPTFWHIPEDAGPGTGTYDGRKRLRRSESGIRERQPEGPAPPEQRIHTGTGANSLELTG